MAWYCEMCDKKHNDAIEKVECEKGHKYCEKSLDCFGSYITWEEPEKVSRETCPICTHEVFKESDPEHILKNCPMCGNSVSVSEVDDGRMSLECDKCLFEYSARVKAISVDNPAAEYSYEEE